MLTCCTGRSRYGKQRIAELLIPECTLSRLLNHVIVNRYRGYAQILDVTPVQFGTAPKGKDSEFAVFIHSDWLSF